MGFPALMSGHCPQRDGWKAEKKSGNFIPRVSYTHLYSFPRLTLSSGNPSACLFVSSNVSEHRSSHSLEQDLACFRTFALTKHTTDIFEVAFPLVSLLLENLSGIDMVLYRHGLLVSLGFSYSAKTKRGSEETRKSGNLRQNVGRR